VTYYTDDQVTLHHGDALDVSRLLPDAAADCIVTSPPYFGLRSYLPDGVILRDDLTDNERAYVLSELDRLGIS
jgi:DNA modification methylase